MSERKYSRETLEKRKAKRLVKSTGIDILDALKITRDENMSLDDLQEEYREYLSTKKKVQPKEDQVVEKKKSKPSKKPRKKPPVIIEEKKKSNEPVQEHIIPHDDELNKELLEFREKFKDSLKRSPSPKQESPKPVVESPKPVVSQFQNQQPHDPFSHDPFSYYKGPNEPPKIKNPAPSSQKIKAEEWLLLSQLEPDIMKLALQILYEETVKYENGSSSYTAIDYAICLALDRIKSVRKSEEETLRKEKETKEAEDLAKKEEEYDSEEEHHNETDEQRRERVRRERLAWVERNFGNKKIEKETSGDNSTTISVPN